MSAVTAPLCSTLLFVGLFVFVSAGKIIIAESGQNITLPCQTANNNNIIAVKWSRTDLGEEYVLLYRDGHFEPAKQHPFFKNRVDLQDKQMKDGDASLILMNLTINDTGTYECRFIMSGTKNAPSNITLTVVDPPGQTGGDTEDGSVGLKIGLPVSVLLVVVVVVVLVYFMKLKCKNRKSLI